MRRNTAVAYWVLRGLETLMSLSKLLISLGSVLLGAVLVLQYVPGLFSWFGRLPGDIRVGDEQPV